ncbi:MAG: OmpA family protein [Chitinophagales bacterium]|nr:OmpA family protein [Chitinophagaceae bacterium]MCB9065951.1 OmpA family protein [Chitinophagales bacterium]
MRKNWLLLLLATILVTVNIDANAQQQRKDKYRNKADDPVSKLPYYKKLRWADGLYKEGSYFNAADYYLQLKEEQPRNPYLTYQLAECYWMTRDYVPAAHYYGEVYNAASKLYPEAKFKEAMMLKKAGNYNESIEAFNKFIADNPKTFKPLKKRSLREIEGCNVAMNSMMNPEAVTVKNAGPNVNSAYTESAPLPLGDTALLFSTMRQNDLIEVDKKKRGDYMSRFMTSTKQKYTSEVDSFQWPLPFKDGDFNSDKVHISNGCYSPGGERFYFTKCKEGDSMSVECKIYVSKFGEKGWEDAEELGEGINDGPSNTQPWVAKVGKKEVLFFASNRTLQSRGGYDIWYSVIDPRRGTYRRPQNAGKQINTPQNEQTPYYDSRENKLYFASDGWVTMGGFDIFSAVGGPSRYTNLTNLGYPINTSADELYYVRDPLGKPDAYVVSNRVGAMALKNPTCCDDIWRIQYEPKLYVRGTVVNRETQEPIEEVVVKMVDESGDMKTFNSTDGKFGFNLMRGHSYVLTGDKEQYSTNSAAVNTMEVKRTDDDDTVNVMIYMDRIQEKYTFMVSNVYYDYNKATLRAESIASLDTLVNFMQSNPSFTVEVYSFTDAHGTDEYNKKLSLARAQSVIDYLSNAGIDQSRMTAKGFGESMPAAPNMVNGKDNEAGRQLNRRTEFRIISDIPTRRVLYNSAKPGDMDAQMQNLQVDDSMYDDDEGDDAMGNPGSRVNR